MHKTRESIDEQQAAERKTVKSIEFKQTLNIETRSNKNKASVKIHIDSDKPKPALLKSKTQLPPSPIRKPKYMRRRYGRVVIVYTKAGGHFLTIQPGTNQKDVWEKAGELLNVLNK